MAWPPSSSASWSIGIDLDIFATPVRDLHGYVSDAVIYNIDTHVMVLNAITGSYVEIGSSIDDFESGGVQVDLSGVVFKGDLYVRAFPVGGSDSGDEYSAKAFKYSGTPHSWLEVWDSGLDPGTNESVGITADLNNILIGEFSGQKLQISTAPALGAWSNIPLSPSIANINFNDSKQDVFKYNANDGNTVYLVIQDLDGVVEYMYRFDGNQLTRIGNALGGSEYRRTPGYFWRLNNPNWEWSADCVTWNVPDTTPTVEPLISINYKKTFGTLNNRIYFWDDSINDWSTIIDDAPVPSVAGPDIYIIVLSDGTVIYGIKGTTPKIMQRGGKVDLAYLTGSNEARFYYDTNSLTERSTLPVSKVPLRGMGLHEPTSQIAVPNANAEDYMVALGDLEQLYTQWRDISYDIDKTNGLKVLRWV